MLAIELLYFNAGGGHRSAALALQAAIAQQGRPWQVRLTNLVDVLDPNGRLSRLLGMPPEDLYNRCLARGWTLGMAQELKLLQALIRLGHRRMLRPLSAHFARSAPDLVVSLVPNFNRVLCQGAAQGAPAAPFVTVMTDLADHPPHFWIEPGQAQTLVCGSARAVEQARQAGYPQARIARVSGMLLRPAFHQPVDVDRDAERARLGVAPRQAMGLVMFGGHGASAMRDIARALPDIPLILMCGHNEALASELRALPQACPRRVVGFTSDVQRHMHLADFFIGKPGPGCLSEAVHMGLPVVVARNAWTLPQERYNADWVREHGLGVVHRSMRTLRPAVRSLIARLPELRANVRRMHNRALFEVLDLFERLLAA